MVAFSAFNVTYDIWLVMMTEQVLKKTTKKKYNTNSDWNRWVETSQQLLLLLVR